MKTFFIGQINIFSNSLMLFYEAVVIYFLLLSLLKGNTMVALLFVIYTL